MAKKYFIREESESYTTTGYSGVEETRTRRRWHVCNNKTGETIREFSDPAYAYEWVNLRTNKGKRIKKEIDRLLKIQARLAKRLALVDKKVCALYEPLLTKDLQKGKSK